MDQLWIDYIKKQNIFDKNLNIDFSDLDFVYDYNEVQELYFDTEKNNYVFLAGETGLRKKEMLARICQDLILRGVEKEEILYLDYELPILHRVDVFDPIKTFYAEHSESDTLHLVINEVQECGDWFSLAVKLHANYPKIKLLVSSSTPSYIFEKIYDEDAEYCKIVVLSKKNHSNIKYKSQSFGVYNEFKYNIKDGFVEVKGVTKEGKIMAHHIVPSEIAGLPVKIISSGAFHDRKEMLSIELPDSIEMIGDYAFSKCFNLEEIHLPKSLTYIGDHSFLGAKKLRYIIGGDLVEHIGNSAFYGTAWLEEAGDFAIIGQTLYKYGGDDKIIVLADEIKYVSAYAFAKTKIELIDCSNIKKIEEGTFFQCKNLKHFIGKLDSIPPFAFYSCKSLETYFEIDTVGKFGLYHCNSITGIKAKGIGSCGMAFCENLKEAKVSDKIDDGAFYACSLLDDCSLDNTFFIGKFAIFGTNLKKAIFLKANQIGDYALSNNQKLTKISINVFTQIGKNILYRCNAIKEMTISGTYKLSSYFANIMPKIENLTIIDNIVDDFCRNNPYLKKLTLINVRHFGRWSFYNNSSLSKVIFENVELIGDWAFAHCDKITEVVLPDSVNFIGMNAFRYCHNLSSITIQARQLILFGTNAFYSTAENKQFYMRKSVIIQAKTAPIWREYSNMIIEI